MTSDYVARLFCLSLAVFFAVHLLSGIAISAATPWIARFATLLRPRIAARVLLAFRFTPIALGVFVVAVLCVPSYLWLEPDEAVEEIGALCLMAAVLTLAVCSLACVRGCRTVLRSCRSLRAWRAAGRPSPMLAIGGVFRPRLLLSKNIRRLFSRDELAAALRHEQAHARAWDNGKRLLLAFTPALLPGLHGFTALELHWSRLTEYAADDDAVRGDPARSLSLASALVLAARMSSVRVPLAASLLDGEDLAVRVDRLLHPAPRIPWDVQPVIITAAAGMTLAASVASLALRPITLESAHALLETLIR